MSPIKTRRVPCPSSPVTWGPPRYQLHQARSESFLQRLAGEVVLLRRMERHDPTGVVDGPGARAAGGGDRCATHLGERGLLTSDQRRHAQPCRGHPKGHPEGGPVIRLSRSPSLLGSRHVGILADMAEMVTRERIAATIARAEKGAYRPGGDRRSPFPDPVEDIHASCASMGRAASDES